MKIGPCYPNSINFPHKISKFSEYIKIMIEDQSEVWKFSTGSWLYKIVARGCKYYQWGYLVSRTPKINFFGTTVMLFNVFIGVPKDIFLRKCIRWIKSTRKWCPSVTQKRKESFFLAFNMTFRLLDLSRLYQYVPIRSQKIFEAKPLKIAEMPGGQDNVRPSREF